MDLKGFARLLREAMPKKRRWGNHGGHGGPDGRCEDFRAGLLEDCEAGQTMTT